MKEEEKKSREVRMMKELHSLLMLSPVSAALKKVR